MDAPAENPAKAQRRQEILDAAFLEFSAKGYAGASMAAIARRASASKETLYAWFDNKETLFNTLIASRLDGMVSRVSAVVATEELAPAKVLPVVAEDIIRFMLAMAPLERALGAAEPGAAVMRRVGQTIAEERARFVDYLLRCRDQGYVAFEDDPFELVSLFVAMAEGEWGLRLATGMVDEITDRMMTDHAQRVTRIFLRGLALEGT
jgi:AcrR family transcriptional regulator